MQNKTDFFQQKPEPNVGDSKQKTLKDDCRLFSTNFTSCQSREYDLMDFFSMSISLFPLHWVIMVISKYWWVLTEVSKNSRRLRPYILCLPCTLIFFVMECRNDITARKQVIWLTPTPQRKQLSFNILIISVLHTNQYAVLCIWGQETQPVNRPVYVKHNIFLCKYNCMPELLGLPLVLHILQTFSISLKAMHLLTPIRPKWWS
jgi:hypothetical protein